MGEKSFLFFISLSRRAPQAPRLPGDWDPGARQEPRTVDSSDRLLSGLPQSPTSQSSRFAESYKWSLPLSRKVTNLNQDLTPRKPLTTELLRLLHQNQGGFGLTPMNQVRGWARVH